MLPGMQKLINRHDVAALLNVSIRTVDEKIASGDIPVVRIGRSVRFRPEALELYVEALETRIRFRRRR